MFSLVLIFGAICTELTLIRNDTVSDQCLQQNVTRSVAPGELIAMLVARAKHRIDHALSLSLMQLSTMYQVTTYSGIQQGWRTIGTRETPELALQLLTALTRIKPSFNHCIQCDFVDVQWEWVVNEVPVHY